MKKLLLSILWGVLATSMLTGQNSGAFTYQAIARDLNGQIIVEQNIGIQISLIQGSKDGPVVYSETHTVRSNDFGLISLYVGKGDVEKGVFLDITWSDFRYFIRVAMDLERGDDYQTMGTSEILSVPYALYAEKAGTIMDRKKSSASIQKNPASIQNTGSRFRGPINSRIPSDGNTLLNLNIGKVGIGTEIPLTMLDVNGHINIVTDSSFMINAIPVLQNRGLENIFAGNFAGNAMDGGSGNTALGHEALFSNTTGSKSTAIGYRSLCLQTGHLADDNMYNTAVGYEALYHSNPTDLFNARENVAVGHQALKENTIGSYNTAVGYQALLSNQTGRDNVSMGKWNLKANTSGKENTAIGVWTLSANLTGRANVAVGFRTLADNIDGDFNVAVGDSAGFAAKGSGNVFLGHRAGASETGSNTLYIDNSNTPEPLIHGDFEQDILRVNGTLLGDISYWSKVVVGAVSLSAETQVLINASTDENFGVLVNAQNTAGTEIGLHTGTGYFASLAKNAYHDGDWHRFNVSYGAYLQEIGPDGDIYFKAMGPDPNPIFWNTAMVIKNNGRVGIGDGIPQTQLDVNSNAIRIQVPDSPASNADGFTGEIRWDANYIYVCTNGDGPGAAADTWKRSALTNY